MRTNLLKFKPLPYTLIIDGNWWGKYESVEAALADRRAEMQKRRITGGTVTERYKIYREERNAPIQLVAEN